MSQIDKLSEQFDLKNWPHLFTKDGPSIQVGEIAIGEDSRGAKDPIFAVPMRCIHCGAKYLNGKDSRPPDPCPARNKSREMKRLLS